MQQLQTKTVHSMDFSVDITIQLTQARLTDLQLADVVFPINYLNQFVSDHATQKSPCSASSLDRQRDTTRICCWAPAPASDRYLLSAGRSAANPPHSISLYFTLLTYLQSVRVSVGIVQYETVLSLPSLGSQHDAAPPPHLLLSAGACSKYRSIAGIHVTPAGRSAANPPLSAAVLDRWAHNRRSTHISPLAASLLCCNSLPSDIQSSPSLPVFRQRLRTFLFVSLFPEYISVCLLRLCGLRNSTAILASLNFFDWLWQTGWQTEQMDGRTLDRFIGPLPTTVLCTEKLVLRSRNSRLGEQECGRLTSFTDRVANVQIKSILDEIVGALPDPFNMQEIMSKVPPEDRTPYVIVAFQECERMNALTSEIRRSLKELDLGLKVNCVRDFLLSSRSNRGPVVIVSDMQRDTRCKSIAVIWFHTVFLRLFTTVLT